MGLIHLDAGLLIAVLDGNDAHHDAAATTIGRAMSSGHRLAMSASALAECLVGPARHGDPAIQVVRDFVERVPISTVALDVDIAVTAARLRARHRSLRLPDALVIATAVHDGADELITTDRNWPAARALRARMRLTVL